MIIRSEGEIFLIVFAEIHGLCPGRNTLEGIILESHAATVICSDSVFGAQDTAVIQFGAVKAVGTGSFDFLPEQHGVRLFSHDFSLYNMFPEIATDFSKFRRITDVSIVAINIAPTKKGDMRILSPD